MASEFPYLYPYSCGDAARREESSKYDESFRINVCCARDIEQAIRDYLSGESIQPGCADGILEKYGHKRVNFVLANSVKEMGLPYLLDESIHQWCKHTFVPPDSHHNRYFAVDTAAALLSEFIQQTRQAYQTLELFGPEHCESNSYSELDYEGKVLVLSPDTLKESCWAPQNQLWLAHDGFGCRPKAIGRSIRCTCLGDGEMTRWNRAEFSGVLKEEFLPDWAAEKLAELQAPQQEQDTGPAMGGMSMG